MGYKFNPFVGGLDAVDSPNGVFEALDVNGDITLDDGGTYTTTLQTITPTVSNKTISLPDATGTVALVAGSSGQLVYNNAGAQAGAPGSVVGATGDITLTLNGAASTPPLDITGTWFTGGTSTTTKPQVLIEPAGTTSTAWSTSGTGLGVNAASGFAGNLLDLQVNGSNVFSVLNSNPKQITFGGAQFVSRNANSAGTNFYGVLAVGDRLEIGVGSTGASGTVGTPTLYKDTNHLLGLRGAGGESLAPLSFAIYNTYTSLTNFERGYARWRGGTCYGTISGTTLTLTGASASGIFATGQRIVGTGITAGTTIVSLNSGTLGAIGSTYTVSISQTVASQVTINTYSDVFEIGAEKGSAGGTARTVEVHTDSIARLALDATGSVRVVTALTVATLPGTPAVGMVARVTDATAPVVGTTVAGGGAAAALCWYNGANWSVIGV